MFGTKCIMCLQPSNKMFTVGRITQKFLRYNQKIKYCTIPKVPEDTLKSKINEFSGIKSTVFETEPVQTIIKRMTTIDLDKVFAGRKEELSKPSYSLLSSEELKEEEAKIHMEAEKRLKMPEVRSLRSPINVEISQDPELIHTDDDSSKFVFTDISPSETFRTRAVIIRENDTGVLREANWDERDRMEFLYWPKEGQMYELAPMLQDEHLPYSFNQLQHGHVLDFINIQCEPDSPDYIRVTHSVYEDIAKREAFDVLKSTRYYGGMIFYFVNNRKTTEIFGSFIRNGLYDDAADIVRLHSLIHNDSQFQDNDNASIIQEYVKKNKLNDLLSYLNEDESVSVSQ